MEKLSYRFTRKKKEENGIEDVYDGHLYKRLSADNGFLSNPDNISLLDNTDGVALVRSSKAGVWPIYYVINELPPRERYMLTVCLKHSFEYMYVMATKFGQLLKYRKNLSISHTPKFQA